MSGYTPGIPEEEGFVGRPSTLKSPSLKEVLKPMKALEEEANIIFEKEYKDYLCKVEEFKAHKEAIKKKITKAVLSLPAHEVGPTFPTNPTFPTTPTDWDLI